MPEPNVVLLVGGRSQPENGSRYVLGRHAALLLTESGTGFVLDMADRFYAVAPVTALMLAQTLRCGEAEAARCVASRCGVDAAVVRADLDRLLDDLATRGVIHPRGAPDRSGKRSGGAAAVARIGATVLPTLASDIARAVVALTLARFSFVSFGWLATIAAWQKHIPSHIAECTDCAKASVRISAAVRAVSARFPFGGDCKERALSSWAMARLAGVDAAIVVGVAQYPFRAHSWCETGSCAVLGDDAARCRRYLPVFRYR